MMSRPKVRIYVFRDREKRDIVNITNGELRLVKLISNQKYFGLKVGVILGDGMDTWSERSR